jgi:hypothetical protein
VSSPLGRTVKKPKLDEIAARIFELGLVSRQTRRIRARKKKKRLHLSLNPIRRLERFAHRSPWTSSPQIVLFARR